MIFVALEIGLKLDDSSRSSWIHPDPGNPAGGRERNAFLALDSKTIEP